MHLWTSEFVSRGHPDKVADQIADAVLDAHLDRDPLARVACEVMLTGKEVVVGGEVGSSARVDIEPLVRRTICGLGYDTPERSYDGNAVQIIDRINVQSPEIAQAVCKTGGEVGAGDQGIMFGYAANETPTFMPLTHELAREIITRLEADIDQGRRQGGWESPFLPDAKSQVTVRYNGPQATGIDTIVVSALHAKETSLDELRRQVDERILTPMREQHPGLFTPKTRCLINPGGAWHLGGPAADTGLTGRKTAIDSYGADCPVGGGSFSGKDPTKVDRSGAYVTRYLAKNVVAAGFADRATVQLAYAIGVSAPVSFRILTHGTGKHLPDDDLTRFVQDRIDLTPKGIIDRFQLRRPIYRQTAAGGHFGRPELPWEKLDFELNPPD